MANMQYYKPHITVSAPMTSHCIVKSIILPFHKINSTDHTVQNLFWSNLCKGQFNVDKIQIC